MRSPDSATTRLNDYIVEMLPWAHGHHGPTDRLSNPVGPQLWESGGGDQALVAMAPYRTANAALFGGGGAAPSARPAPGPWTRPAGHRLDGRLEGALANVS